MMRTRRHLRPGQANNFHIETADDVLDFWGKISAILFLALPMLVGISLVVGGIVIMNIMLMAVAERTREIGVRKALGARRRDILRQFLVESATLSTTGAMLGIVTGLALAKLVNVFFSLPATITPGGHRRRHLPRRGRRRHLRRLSRQPCREAGSDRRPEVRVTRSRFCHRRHRAARGRRHRPRLAAVQQDARGAHHPGNRHRRHGRHGDGGHGQGHHKSLDDILAQTGPTTFFVFRFAGNNQADDDDSDPAMVALSAPDPRRSADDRRAPRDRGRHHGRPGQPRDLQWGDRRAGQRAGRGPAWVLVAGGDVVEGRSFTRWKRKPATRSSSSATRRPKPCSATRTRSSAPSSSPKSTTG